MENPLPPPAKWSPAGDEPIHREKKRGGGPYVAVQPTMYPAPYTQSLQPGYPPQSWTSAAFEPQSAYVFNLTTPVSHATYSSYPYPPFAFPHGRSQSHSYDQENMQFRNHMRSYSQTLFEYRCGDIHMTANELVRPEVDPQWIGSGQYPYHGSTFAPLTNINYQSTWLRT